MEEISFGCQISLLEIHGSSISAHSSAGVGPIVLVEGLVSTGDLLGAMLSVVNVAVRHRHQKRIAELRLETRHVVVVAEILALFIHLGVRPAPFNFLAEASASSVVPIRIASRLAHRLVRVVVFSAGPIKGRVFSFGR